VDEFELSTVEIYIYSMQGKLIQQLGKHSYSAGNNSITLSAEQLQSGMYYYQLYINSIPQEIKKMMVKK